MTIRTIASAGWIKQSAANVLCSQPMGQLLRKVFRNRIPHRRNTIEVPDDVNPAIPAMLFWGVYESAEIRFVKKYLSDELPVVELGSSLGGVSCEIAKRLRGRQKLVCVEANPHLAPYLKRNIARNCPAQSVAYYHAAISYVDADYTQFGVEGDSLCSSLNDDGIEVPTLTLGQILNRESFTEFRLVSDIEGAEWELLTHDLSALKRCKQTIIEMHETRDGSRLRTVDELVEQWVARTHHRLVARYGPVCVFEA
jgi:FkbM family methyltransferase